MSAEARMFLILIHIFSNSHPTPIPNTCLKCFTWPNLSFGKFSYSNFKFFIVFENFQTKFEPHKIWVLIKRKECTWWTSCVSFLFQKYKFFRLINIWILNLVQTKKFCSDLTDFLSIDIQYVYIARKKNRPEEGPKDIVTSLWRHIYGVTMMGEMGDFFIISI